MLAFRDCETPMRNRFLELLVRAVTWRPRAVIAVAVLLAACGILYSATVLRLNSDTNTLVSPDRPYMARYRSFLEEFGGLEFIYLVVDAHGDARRAEPAVAQLVELLVDAPGIEGVHGLIEPAEQLRIATRAAGFDSAAAPWVSRRNNLRA